MDDYKPSDRGGKTDARLNLIVDRAKQVGMPAVDPERMEMLLVKQMLEDFFRVSTGSVREQIAAAYQTFLGVPMNDFSGAELEFVSSYLRGPPGHGKSSVIEAAGRCFARLMGLTFHPVVPSGPLGKGDVVLLAREMAGEVSTLSTRGIFDRTVHRDRPVTTRIPFIEFERARDAAFTILVFEDIATALEPVQASLLGFIRRRYSEGEDFRNCFVVLTGNLGAEDGAMTFSSSTAITGRTRNYYLEDTVEAFERRMLQRFTDQWGSGLVVEFLKAHPDLFPGKPNAAEDARRPMAQPRTWASLAVEMRSILSARAHSPRSLLFFPTQSAGNFREVVWQAAASHVGCEAADAFSAFVDVHLSSARPLADRMFSAALKNIPDDDAAAQVATAAGQGVRNTGDHAESSFQVQYADCCRDVALAYMLNQGRSTQDYDGAFETGLAALLVALNEPFFFSRQKSFILSGFQSRALWELGRRLAARKEFGDALKYGHVSYSRTRLAERLRDRCHKAATRVNEVMARRYDVFPYNEETVQTKLIDPLMDQGAL